MRKLIDALKSVLSAFSIALLLLWSYDVAHLEMDNMSKAQKYYEQTL